MKWHEIKEKLKEQYKGIDVEFYGDVILKAKGKIVEVVEVVKEDGEIIEVELIVTNYSTDIFYEDFEYAI